MQLATASILFKQTPLLVPTTALLHHGILLKYIHYESLRRNNLVLEKPVELGPRGIPDNTTALPRHGILLKYVHYQSLRRIRLVLEEAVKLGSRGYQTIRQHSYVMEYY